MNLSVPQLQALVQAATLAPSNHNKQPWLFRIEDQAIELLAERTRALPVNHPDDRELIISCGCALFNLGLAAWMHPRRPADGLSLPALAIPVAQMVVPIFNTGHGVVAKDRQLADESPVLAVPTTVGDSPRDWLAAGQALQRLLLLGVQLGLQASHLNQPVQVATLRRKLQQLTGRQGYTQLLLRIGTPTQVKPAAPRRPLADVLVTAS